MSRYFLHLCQSFHHWNHWNESKPSWIRTSSISCLTWRFRPLSGLLHHCSVHWDLLQRPQRTHSHRCLPRCHCSTRYGVLSTRHCLHSCRLPPRVLPQRCGEKCRGRERLCTTHQVCRWACYTLALRISFALLRQIWLKSKLNSRGSDFRASA